MSIENLHAALEILVEAPGPKFRHPDYTPSPPYHIYAGLLLFAKQMRRQWADTVLSTTRWPSVFIAVVNTICGERRVLGRQPLNASWEVEADYETVAVKLALALLSGADFGQADWLSSGVVPAFEVALREFSRYVEHLPKDVSVQRFARGLWNFQYETKHGASSDWPPTMDGESCRNAFARMTTFIEEVVKPLNVRWCPQGTGVCTDSEDDTPVTNEAVDEALQQAAGSSDPDEKVAEVESEMADAESESGDAMPGLSHSEDGPDL